MLLHLGIAELLVSVSKGNQHLPQLWSSHTSHSHLLLHWKTALMHQLDPHSSSRNSAQQFENKLCYCH